jgi:hypothetical protein
LQAENRERRGEELRPSLLLSRTKYSICRNAPRSLDSSFIIAHHIESDCIKNMNTNTITSTARTGNKERVPLRRSRQENQRNGKEGEVEEEREAKRGIIRLFRVEVDVCVCLRLAEHVAGAATADGWGLVVRTENTEAWRSGEWNGAEENVATRQR